MKRILLTTLTVATLLVPTLASAQEWKLVYRPELHGMVAMRVPQAPATATPAAEKVTPTPAQVIATHEPMARGYRVIANDRGGANLVAAAHCERLIAKARADIRRNQ